MSTLKTSSYITIMAAIFILNSPLNAKVVDFHVRNQKKERELKKEVDRKQCNKARKTLKNPSASSKKKEKARKTLVKKDKGV